MRLHSIRVRFYRSLNYDYLRASNPDYQPEPWDETHAGTFPFVRIKLRPQITTIVGANESGKSQVLRAVEAALTGHGFERSDFCRYSRFFGVNDVLGQPEFGAVLTDLTPAEAAVVRAISGKGDADAIERLAVFRMNETPNRRLYVRQGGTWSSAAAVTDEDLEKLNLPVPFRIDADVPLPDAVPIEYLVSGAPVAAVGRDALRSLWDVFTGHADWFASDATVQTNANSISTAFRASAGADPHDLATYGLAADLIYRVAGIQKVLIEELQRAVREKNGYAQSIVDTINSELSRALNFPHWWSQDSRFELFVSLFEYDLVFMIRDRTGRTYGFDERSDGLKYFLSYFVQYLAHDFRQDGRKEVLLMDEPDRFLSSSGQQDLLRIFDDFADPEDVARRPLQVVYVTHSPFLIDKNDADRIRVLEKGEYDEGTRIVSNAAANHYEPLRSAFGSFVAETTFIGNCNLMVEGVSDQILIAGASRWLRSRGVPERDRFDLNAITIVPAGGTRHIPYLVYLARGRDVDKPPIIVLLDNDGAGNAAKRDLARGGAYGEKLIDPSLVLQLAQDGLSSLQSSNPLGTAGIEDLVPLTVAIEALRIYCSEFVPEIDVSRYTLDSRTVFSSDPDAPTTHNRGLLRHLEASVAEQSGIEGFHLDKVAFARAVVDVLSDLDRLSAVPTGDATMLEENLRLLLAQLALKQRAAERAESTDKISSRINRAKREFTRTHPAQARKEDVLDLIEEIGSQLDLSPEAEEVRSTMRQWHRRFELDEDPRTQIEDYPAVLAAIDSLAYQAVRTASTPAHAPSGRQTGEPGS